jgi:hypothetical protein
MNHRRRLRRRPHRTVTDRPGSALKPAQLAQLHHEPQAARVWECDHGLRRLHDEPSGGFEGCTANRTFASKVARRLRRWHGCSLSSRSFAGRPFQQSHGRTVLAEEAQQKHTVRNHLCRTVKIHFSLRQPGPPTTFKELAPLNFDPCRRPLISAANELGSAVITHHPYEAGRCRITGITDPSCNCRCYLVLNEV